MDTMIDFKNNVLYFIKIKNLINYKIYFLFYRKTSKLFIYILINKK